MEGGALVVVDRAEERHADQREHQVALARRQRHVVPVDQPHLVRAADQHVAAGAGRCADAVPGAALRGAPAAALRRAARVRSVAARHVSAVGTAICVGRARRADRPRACAGDQWRVSARHAGRRLGQAPVAPARRAPAQQPPERAATAPRSGRRRPRAVRRSTRRRRAAVRRARSRPDRPVARSALGIAGDPAAARRCGRPEPGHRARAGQLDRERRAVVGACLATPGRTGRRRAVRRTAWSSRRRSRRPHPGRDVLAGDGTQSLSQSGESGSTDLRSRDFPGVTW